jgi:hypothetical protein
MASKPELVEQAAALGIEGHEEMTKPQLEAAIAGAAPFEPDPFAAELPVLEVEEFLEEAPAPVVVQEKFPAGDLEKLSERLFQVPRSVFVGARSAGFIPDSVTKAEAEEGILKFKSYSGKET